MGANTAFGSADALTKKLFSEVLYRAGNKSMFFTDMSGKGKNNIIEIKDEFMKGKGDKITFGLVMDMSAAGQVSTSTGVTLEGNEEALSFYDFAITLAEVGHSVKAGSTLDLQRPAFDLRKEMKDGLVNWVPNKIETLLVTALLASPSTNRHIDETASPYGAMTLETLRRAKRKAKLASPKILPVKIDGKDVYVALLHPMAIKGLLADNAFTGVLQYAQNRGNANPLISGADYFVDGIAIYEYDRSEMLSTGNVCTSLFLGAQAGVIGWASKPSWNEKLFDYDTVPGVGTKFLVAVGKTKFNSQDFGVIAIDNTYVSD